MVPFVYREFYDVPRLIVFKAAGRVYLLDSPFDNERDDYSDLYAVYEIQAPILDLKLAIARWNTLPKRLLGYHPVSNALFDASKRKLIDEGLLPRLVPKP